MIQQIKYGVNKMTREEFRQYVRSLLAEPQASYWENDEIDLYTDIALINLTNKFWYMLAPIYNKKTSLTINSETMTADLPVDCLKVISITPIENYVDFDYIPQDLVNTYGYHNWSGWTFEEGKIKVYNPKSFEFTLYYLPKFIFDNIPDQMKPLLAVETIIQAKVKDENVPTYLLLLQKNFTDSLLLFLSQNQMQNSDILTE